MIKKKLAKMLTTCLMSVFIIGTASMTVHAESVRETEPNNTTISLYYAYPVTSTYVEDDVVIIQ